MKLRLEFLLYIIPFLAQIIATHYRLQEASQKIITITKKENPEKLTIPTKKRIIFNIHSIYVW